MKRLNLRYVEVCDAWLAKLWCQSNDNRTMIGTVRDSTQTKSQNHKLTPQLGHFLSYAWVWDNKIIIMYCFTCAKDGYTFTVLLLCNLYFTHTWSLVLLQRNIVWISDFKRNDVHFPSNLEFLFLWQVNPYFISTLMFVSNIMPRYVNVLFFLC